MMKTLKNKTVQPERRALVMKKLIMWVILTLTLIVGVGIGTPALAKTVIGTGGSTQTKVYIVGNPQQGRLAALVDNIPNGTKPTTGSDGDQVTGTQNGNKKNGSPAAAVATVVKSGSADLIAGRLPQTSESRMVLTSIFGLLLLIVLILSVTVYRQARLLRERE